MSLPRALAGAAAVVILGLAAWYVTRSDSGTADIRRRLQALSRDVNQTATAEHSPEARAAHLGSYFTEDIEVDLGQGTAPIRGRATLIGMAERLQPRTSAFTLRFEDITVAMSPGGETADVHLTAEFIRRSITTNDQSRDAREFTLGLRRSGGDWQISRVTAIDTLK
jgi:hypothetical protein